MRSKLERHSEEAEKTIRDIRRAIRRQYSADEKVRRPADLSRSRPLAQTFLRERSGKEAHRKQKRPLLGPALHARGPIKRRP
jgi:hypothetical protein